MTPLFAVPGEVPAATTGGSPIPFMAALAVIGLVAYGLYVLYDRTGRYVPPRFRPDELKAAQADLYDQTRAQIAHQTTKNGLVTAPRVIHVTGDETLIERMRISLVAVEQDLAEDLKADGVPLRTTPSLQLFASTDRRLTAKVYFDGQAVPDSPATAGRASTTRLAPDSSSSTVASSGYRPTGTPTPRYRPTGTPTPDYKPTGTPTPDYKPTSRLVLLDLLRGTEMTVTGKSAGGRGTETPLCFPEATMLSRLAFDLSPSSTGWTITVFDSAKHGVEVNGVTVSGTASLGTGDRLGVLGDDFAEVVTCTT